MISFENDYSEGAHEEILRRLAEVNKEGITGYGNDSYCESAKERSVRHVNARRQTFTSLWEEHRQIRQ